MGVEDSTRANMNFFYKIIETSANLGAERIRYCDTVGIAEPFLIYEKIKNIKNNFDIEIEMHTHDDMGLALANSLAGIKVGAASIDVTINGIGERCGNVPLEEAVIALKNIYGINSNVNPKSLKQLSMLVEKITKIKMPLWKAVVGENAFNHESGIHQDSILKIEAHMKLILPRSSILKGSL